MMPNPADDVNDLSGKSGGNGLGVAETFLSGSAGGRYCFFFSKFVGFFFGEVGF